jgi:PleD family two-component response regulator
LRVIKNIRKEEAKAMLEKSAVRILVLDDESFMLKLLSRILSNLG